MTAASDLGLTKPNEPMTKAAADLSWAILYAAKELFTRRVSTRGMHRVAMDESSAGVEPITCGSTGVHDASCILCLGRGRLSWVVNSNLLKISKGVHLDALQ